jgi:hypothetical protein
MHMGFAVGLEDWSSLIVVLGKEKLGGRRHRGKHNRSGLWAAFYRGAAKRQTKARKERSGSSSW